MFINDLKNKLILYNVQGLDLEHFKIFLLMYADAIVVFSKTAEGLQNWLNWMHQYCQKWKLTVITQKL